MSTPAAAIDLQAGDVKPTAPDALKIALYIKTSNAAAPTVSNSTPYIQDPAGNETPLIGVAASAAKGGTVTLVAGTANVTFTTAFSDALYQIGFGGNGDETLRWSSQVAGGFTVTSGDSSSTASVHWTATKFGNT